MWYYKFDTNICSENMFDKRKGGIAMRSTADTTQEMRRKKESHKLSRTMAVILGLIVTVEVIVAGGMIFNVDFHSTDMVALFMGFMVLYAGIVAMLTDN